MTILGSEDDKKEDTMMDLQTRLVTNDALANASLVQTDEEAQPQSTTTLLIQVMDEVAVKGEKQPNQFRDAPFAFLFIAHLVAICFFAFCWGIPALSQAASGDNSGNNSQSNASFSGVLGLSLLSSLASMFIISGTLAFMIRHADIVIQFSLIFSSTMTFVMGCALALKGFGGIAVFWFLMAALGAWYAWSVWHRIPFAKANLKTATTAIRTNLGVVGVGLALVGVFVAWACLWVLSFSGIYMHTRKCDSSTGECEDGAIGDITGIFYLLSFYWTVQVIKNILVVTVSGTVGTWWFAPEEASSFCSVAITDSVSRATTYSFGSICFGSLLMAIIQVLHHLIREARRRDQGSVLLCVLECLAGLLESIAEYFNKYAFIYVGLYGYNYLDAGRRVIELFRERGWDTIINDQLVYRVLNLMSFVVGGLTGIAGMLIACMFPGWMEVFGEEKYTAAFLLPFLLGTGLAHVVLGIVASATDTVVVCFAESPNEFEHNYPQLSHEMRTAWGEIYPQEFGL